MKPSPLLSSSTNMHGYSSTYAHKTHRKTYCNENIAHAHTGRIHFLPGDVSPTAPTHTGNFVPLPCPENSDLSSMSYQFWYKTKGRSFQCDLGHLTVVGQTKTIKNSPDFGLSKAHRCDHQPPRTWGACTTVLSSRSYLLLLVLLRL